MIPAKNRIKHKKNNNGGRNPNSQDDLNDSFINSLPHRMINELVGDSD